MREDLEEGVKDAESDKFTPSSKDEEAFEW